METYHSKKLKSFEELNSGHRIGAAEDNDINFKNMTKINESKESNSKIFVDLLADSNTLSHDVSKKIEDCETEEKRKIDRNSIKQNKKTIKEVVPDLYLYIGLISVGLNINEIKESKFQPWDVVSLSESKVLKHYTLERDKLIEFTSNSFLRVYPKGTRFDSSNYDPIKSWICGAQLVSLNLQSLQDDFTLINHIFFKINNETGYVLKPSYLRNSPYEFKQYLAPAFLLDFSILSGIMLQKCMNEQSVEIYVTVQVIGTFEDDKNTILQTDPVQHNFLHPLFSNNNASFSIYEENLSFLLIKIIDNKGNVIARSVIPMMCLMEGYRNVTLYNNRCQEIENSILIIFSKKI